MNATEFFCLRVGQWFSLHDLRNKAVSAYQVRKLWQAGKLTRRYQACARNKGGNYEYAYTWKV